MPAVIGKVGDLIDDQQRGAAQIADPLAQVSLALGPGQRGDEIGQGGEADAVPGAHRLDPQRDGEVALAGAGRPQQVHHLVAGDEVELCERQNALPVERGLEREIEARQRLDRAQACHLQRRLDPAALAQGQLLGQQGVDRLQCADLAALDLAHGVVEHLQGTRYPQADQVAPHPLEGDRDGQFLPHFQMPRSARRCPTAA